MLAFDRFLSIAAVVIPGIILVSAARSEATMQVKLDLLIEFSKASNKAIGLEHKDVAEIEPSELSMRQSPNSTSTSRMRSRKR